MRIEARREFHLEGGDGGRHRLLSGWAAEQIVLSDGRRQVTSLFLPGEWVMPSPFSRGNGASSLLAITSLECCHEQLLGADAELALLSGELDRYLTQWFRAVVRLGSMTAYEKTANLLVEIVERRGGGESIEFPLTQELLADLLGLSQVHVNRTLQQLRRDGMIELQSGRLAILQPALLRTAAQFRTLFPDVRSRPGL